MERFPARLQRCAAAILVGAASGCVSSGHVSDVTPLVEAGGLYREGLGAGVRTAGEAPEWWRAFREPSLDRLIEAALAGNLDQQALAERIEQAAARYRQAGGALFPAVDARGEYRSRWDDLDDASRRSDGQSALVGGFLDWEVDVWGRLRSGKRARRAETEAAVYDWMGGRLLLSTAVAETFYEIQEQRAQLRLARDQIATNETLLGLTRLRFGQGQSSIVDVLQQQEQLASTRVRIPEVEARLGALIYAMDLLVGAAPGHGIEVPDRPLRQPPRLDGGGVPSDLLRFRPDLLAGGSRVRAADARVAEAIADRLPRFTIGAGVAGEGDPGIESLAANALGDLAGPLFDAGIRREEVRLRRSEAREAVAAYSQAYLSAVADVEIALLQERRQRERVDLLEEQLETAQRLLRETRNRYSQGLTDYLPVLAAVVTEQNLQREIVTSRRELLSARIAVHRALGGPMDAVPPPGAADSRGATPSAPESPEP